MKLPKFAHVRSDQKQRGAALLLSFLVLLVIIAIVFQINIVTSTDARVARNDVTLTTMDLAVESAMLQVYQSLIDDAAGGGEEGLEGGAPPGDDLATEGPGGMEGGDEGGGSVDSHMDEWGRPQSTTINELSLRILIQDEDSKYNVLNMLSPDEDFAQEGFDRVVRVLDACREGTLEDIDSAVADEMARAMREHMLQRSDSILPRAALLSDDEENTELGLPLSVREFGVLEPFEDRHFRDYFDREGNRVHSVESFLTVWTAPTVGVNPEGGNGLGGEGGYTVNINTAPLAVLASLFDSREVRVRFWESVRDYRNEEEELDPEEEEIEPMLDEFGEEIVQTKIFEDIEELDEVYDWGAMDAEVKDDVRSLLTVESHVFSVFITARVSTQEEAEQIAEFSTRREQEEYERSGVHIVRTVRAILWRRSDGEDTVIVPLVRWEVLPYAPLEVLDFPEEF